MTPAEMVRQFHEAFGLPMGENLPVPTELRHLRRCLLAEEYAEYDQAEDRDDRVEIADALADMVYVIYGTALTYCIDIDAVIEEVHRSNMSKLDVDGRPIYRADGKVLKGPAFFKPDIAGVLGER